MCINSIFLEYSLFGYFWLCCRAQTYNIITIEQNGQVDGCKTFNPSFVKKSNFPASCILFFGTDGLLLLSWRSWADFWHSKPASRIVLQPLPSFQGYFCGPETQIGALIRVWPGLREICTVWRAYLPDYAQSGRDMSKPMGQSCWAKQDACIQICSIKMEKIIRLRYSAFNLALRVWMHSAITSLHRKMFSLVQDLC